MAKENDAAGTVMLAFVLGTLTGAAVALLMAPATGEDTRRLLADRARDGRERANDAARQGRELVNRGKETIATAIERGREAYEQARTGNTGPATGGGADL